MDTNPATLEPVIRTRALGKSYGRGRAVLKDISLSIMRGESIALIGPTGAGTSTLL